MMSVYTSTHLILRQETTIEAGRAAIGAWLMLSEEGDGRHHLCLTLRDLDTIDRLIGALNEGRELVAERGSDAA